MDHQIPHGGTLHVRPDGSYTYAYGPPGVAGLLHNYYALGCATFASIGGLTFGYDQGVIANVLVMKDFVARWHLSAWDTGLMSTSFSRCMFIAVNIEDVNAQRLPWSLDAWLEP